MTKARITRALSQECPTLAIDPTIAAGWAPHTRTPLPVESCLPPNRRPRSPRVGCGAEGEGPLRRVVATLRRALGRHHLAYVVACAAPGPGLCAPNRFLASRASLPFFKSTRTTRRTRRRSRKRRSVRPRASWRSRQKSSRRGGCSFARETFGAPADPVDQCALGSPGRVRCRGSAGHRPGQTAGPGT